MSDLIRREDAIKALGECPLNWTDTAEEIQEVKDWEYHKACIEAVDAVDAVSVVRCEECRYYLQGECIALHTMTKADDFCSYAERRQP